MGHGNVPSGVEDSHRPGPEPFIATTITSRRITEAMVHGVFDIVQG
jgi:hypothetical protein